MSRAPSSSGGIRRGSLPTLSNAPLDAEIPQRKIPHAIFKSSPLLGHERTHARRPYVLVPRRFASRPPTDPVLSMNECSLGSFPSRLGPILIGVRSAGSKVDSATGVLPLSGRPCLGLVVMRRGPAPYAQKIQIEFRACRRPISMAARPWGGIQREFPSTLPNAQPAAEIHQRKIHRARRKNSVWLWLMPKCRQV